MTAWSLTITAVELLGLFNAAHAVMRVRAPSSALAWATLLIALPWIAIPAYWVLGRSKFNGYGHALKKAQERYRTSLEDLLAEARTTSCQLAGPLRGLSVTAQRLLPLGFTAGNRAQVLIDGVAIFEAMLAAIAAAEDYILLQVYILRDDASGERFLGALGERAAAGVRVCLLYDEVGSFELPERFLARVRGAGIQASGFKTTRGPNNRFQINFRNHRKILVVDGAVGFCGGSNIGDEYLGLDAQIGAWRDTQIQLEGPAVKALQASFLGDWFWATGGSLHTRWDPPIPPAGSIQETGAPALVAGTGPSDEIEVCSLLFQAIFASALERLWIATPYLVPNRATLADLKSAALRGVAVRLLVPERADHLIPRLCALSYYEELSRVGIEIFHYTTGFMHQKTILVDRSLAVVGSVNIDNRSFHLNFEITAISGDPQAISGLESALEQDFANSVLADPLTYSKAPLWRRIVIRATRLFSGQL